MIEPPFGGFKMEKHLNSIRNVLPRGINQTLRRASNGVKYLVSGQNFLVLVMAFGVLFRILPILEPIEKAEAELVGSEIKEIEGRLVFVQENSLLAISSPSSPEKVCRKINVVATAYSSSIWETDETPHITAAGTWVRDGIIANNILPFGTKVRMPELYGNKVFVVEDRMNWRKGNYQIDIWFASHQEAENFGAKTTYIEILEG